MSDEQGASALHEQRRYDAFISYSHAVDGQLAPAIQGGLQGLAKPWWRRRAVGIFRDRTSLSATPELWGSIESAMRLSCFFILMASPEAAASRWVQQEVRWWLDNRDTDHMLIALTSGSIRWDQHSSGFDQRRSDALPSVLLKRLSKEPLWVDFTSLRDSHRLTLRNPQFQEKIADLASALRAVPKEDLVGEDIRMHRRAIRIARSAVVLLLVLALAATSSAVFAFAQRDRAEREAAIATGRALAATSAARLNGNLDSALLLGREAWRRSHTPEAKGALLQAVTASPNIKGFWHHRLPLISLASNASGVIAAGASDGSVLRIVQGRPMGLPSAGRSPIRAVALSPRGSVVVVGNDDGVVTLVGESGHVTWTHRIAADRGAESLDSDRNPTSIGALAVSRDADIVVAASSGGLVTALDGRTGREVGAYAAREAFHLAPRFMAIPDYGDYAVVGDPFGNTVRLTLPTVSRPIRPSRNFTPAFDFQPQPPQNVSSAAGYSADGAVYAYDTLARVTASYTTNLTQATRFAAQGPLSPTALAVSPSGHRVAISGDGGVRVIAAGSDALSLDLPGLVGVGQILVMPTDDTVVSAAGTTIAEWDLTRVGPLAETLPVRLPEQAHAFAAAPVAVRPDGRRLVWAEVPLDAGPRLVCWDTATRREIARVPLSENADAIVFSSSGKLVLVGSHEIYLWEANSECGRPDHHWPLLATLGSAVIGFTTPETLLGVGRDGAMWSLDTRSPSPPIRLLKASSDVAGAAISPDGRVVAVARFGGPVELREPKTGKLRRTLPLSARAVSFPDSDSLVVVTREGDIARYGLVSATPAWSVPSPQSIDVRTVGSGLLLAWDDRADAVMFDATTGTLLANFPLVRRDAVANNINLGFGLSLTVSDEKTAWTTLPETSPTSWTLGVEKAESTACELAGRGLAVDELQHGTYTGTPKPGSCAGDRPRSE